jgi:hypothetical protein
MAEIPEGYSYWGSQITSALSEGRDSDAEDLIVKILRAGNADEVVQGLAADMIARPPRKRGRRRTLPKQWLDIASEYHHQRSNRLTYEAAMQVVTDEFKCSETHVRNCVREYDEAKAANDAEAYWQEEQLSRK